MNAHFDLVVKADPSSLAAEFTLRDANGAQIAYKTTKFADLSASLRQGLFDMRNYVRLYVEERKQAEEVSNIGVSIAEKVLGEEIFKILWMPENQRTLRVQLPVAAESDNHLAAALARIPWEIARPTAKGETLGDRNLLVRVVHDMNAPASAPIQLKADEPLRVLFVFAESRGSRPLGARKERHELLRLFEREIYPNRRVVAHFLTHGITRERLAAQIQENGGYHIVHWSGHGHRNQLEICEPGGATDSLTGEELLDIFTGRAGGFLPGLFFLSACQSGDILPAKDWNDFVAIAQGKEPATRQGAVKDIDLKELPGYTGTAHALLRGGVPSVVAMRFAVGDDYARELAVEFYRALLAHAQPKNPAAALTMARQAMRDPDKHDPARFSICDHATPILYGSEEPGLTVARGRSPLLNPRNPRLHPIAELTAAAHEHFVGRTWELEGLGANFIGTKTGQNVKPVAVMTGLGGMGKTALTAEALDLWAGEFEWVLLYQAKPNRLEFEATLRDIHVKLKLELKRYYHHVQANPADAIYRDADADSGFTGQERLNRLTENLLRALKDEAILLVLDNFETNLKDPGPGGQDSECQDPAWDHCLALLAKELVGWPSRVLITSRRPLAALRDVAHSVPLGPLPSSEAMLYLREHPTLGPMVFGADAGEAELAKRVLFASRFHPLLMDRLAKLAAQAPPRAQLMQALETLETTKNFGKLPALFAVKPGDTKELAYLDDALNTSNDLLIKSVGPDARRLLWIIALANQPEALGLVKGVWGGQRLEQERLREIKQLLDSFADQPPEMQEKLNAMPPGLRAMVDALPPEGPPKPDLAPLLAKLVAVGLATEERDSTNDANPNLTCHELVRERIRAWMEHNQRDRAELSETTIRLAYAERLESVFRRFHDENMTTALGAGSRALVYFVEAKAWDKLGDFASRLVTSIADPRQLEALIPHLQTAAESAPEGELRWTNLGILADALSNSGRPDASLTFYAQAVDKARAAAEARGDEAGVAWSDLAVITGNWANALISVGDLDAARLRQRDSVEAKKSAGRPAINIIGSELEILRIDIVQGKVEAALPEVESRLALVETWWQRHRAGQPVVEAPDAVYLARAYISALDVATDAHFAQNDWPSALTRIDAALEVKHALMRPAEDIGLTRMNRANVLQKLRRFSEAKAEMEACLVLFKNDPMRSAKVLSSLANLFASQSDFNQAIDLGRRSLAIRETLSNPSDRAISHNNLANYLERSRKPGYIAEAPRHQLAAFLYQLVAGMGQYLKTSINNYAIDFRRAKGEGRELTIPRVAELLADPAFAPLELWLRQRNVDLDALQAEVDRLIDMARKAADSQ